MTATYTPEVAAARERLERIPKAPQGVKGYRAVVLDADLRVLLADHARLAELAESSKGGWLLACVHAVKRAEEAEARIKALEAERDSWKDDDLNGRVAYDTLREECDALKARCEALEWLREVESMGPLVRGVILRRQKKQKEAAESEFQRTVKAALRAAGE